MVFKISQKISIKHENIATKRTIIINQYHSKKIYLILCEVVRIIIDFTSFKKLLQ